MSKRGQWLFPYRAVDVAARADRKAKHHREREDWWERQLKDAEADLKSAGLEIREMQVSGGTRMDAVLDPHKQARVQECAQNVRHHKDDAERYEAWRSVLHANGEAQIELDWEDVCFFGMGDREQRA